MGLKGLHDNVRGAQVKGTHLGLHRVLGGDHRHRQFPQGRILQPLLHHLIPVLHRHPKVQQHHRDAPAVLPHQKQSLLPVLSLQHIEILFKNTAQHRAVDLHVVRHQYGVPSVHRSPSLHRC